MEFNSIGDKPNEGKTWFKLSTRKLAYLNVINPSRLAVIPNFNARCRLADDAIGVAGTLHSSKKLFCKRCI